MFFFPYIWAYQNEKHMIDKATADKMYVSAIEDLYGAIQTHEIQTGTRQIMAADGTVTEVPVFRASIKLFCETYNIDRPNLMRCFNKENGKDMGVGLFQRCCLPLGLIHLDESAIDEPAIANLSLRHFLRIDGSAVKDAILKLNFM